MSEPRLGPGTPASVPTAPAEVPGRSWWQLGSVYQVYLRSLQDTDGDGVGDLQGLLGRMEQLAPLGVDTLWLSPIHPSPDVDFGYDVADYDGVHPNLGTLADLDRLLVMTRERGMRLILDGVFNHTSDQHAWFQSSRRDPTGPHGDWYLWHAGSGPPNNWQSTFGGPAWTRDPVRGEWYLHSFAPEQPDLNWRNPAVVDAILASMKGWLERGISGFRLDVFNSYLKHPALADNPRRWHPAALAYGYIGQHHVHDRNHPDLAPVLARMRALADSYDAVLVGETLDERFRYEQAERWVGQDRLHLAFHFRLLHSPWGADAFARAIQAWVDELGPGRWPTWVVGNHDFPRVASRWGTRDDGVTQERMRLVALMVCGLRGTPFLYQGDELGLREGRLSRKQLLDPPGKRFWPFYRGRDGCRTPMIWDQGPHGGFTTGTPWLPVCGDAQGGSFQAQEGRPGSVLRAWKRALSTRRTEAVMCGGDMGPVRAEGKVLRWRRSLGREEVEVLLNLGDAPVRLGASEQVGELLLSTHEEPGEDGVLRPREGTWRRRS